MILEIDTSILDRIENLNLNQLILLNIVLNDIKTNNQNIHELISRVSEEDIQYLISERFIVRDELTNVIDSTQKLKDLLKEDKTMFDMFYDQFPVYVVRPDGTKGFLRANINKCRKEYNRIVGKSKAMHQHLCDCLKFEIDQKMMTGKIGYMKTMWKWLTQHEWEASEEQMNYTTQKQETTYGNELL